jgi:iron(III) transport system permease protein
MRRAPALAVGLLLAAPLLALLVHGRRGVSLELLGHLGRTVLPAQAGWSLLVSAGAVLLGALLAGGGLLCGLFAFPGRAVLQRLLLVPLLLPAWFLAAMYREVYRWDGAAGLVAVLGIATAPLFHLFGLAALRNLPQRYAELLRSLGLGSPARLARVLMPLCLPALGAAAALGALLAWADTAGARTMAVPTLAVGLLDQWFGREDASVAVTLGLAVTVLSLAIGWLLLAWLRRRRWQDDARLGEPLRRMPLRGWRALVPWVLSAPQLAAGVLVPGVVIARWTAQRIERVDLRSLGADTARTLLVALGATLLALVLAAVVVHARATGQRAAGAMSLLAFALFAMPPAVLALGALLLLPAGAGAVPAAVASTALPLVAALALRFTGVFVAAIEAAMLRHAREHVALLRVLGRADLSSMAALLRPFLSRPVSAAAALVFLESLKDLVLPLVLQPFGFNTLSTRVFQYAQTQQLRDCAVWVLCLGLIGVYPLFTLARAAEAGSDGR